MAQEPNLQTLRQKARQGWWQDGLTELTTGVVLLYTGGTGYLMETAAPPGKTLWTLLWVLGTVALPLLGGRVLRKMKARWVWPYSGYVKPRQHPLNPLRILTALLLIAGALATLLHWTGLWATGLGLSLFLGVNVGRPTGQARFYTLGILILLLSLFLEISSLTPAQGFFLLLMGAGVLLGATGLWTWTRYRTKTGGGVADG